MNKDSNHTDTPMHIVILKEELKRRTRVNPLYSLRSFAKQLSLDPSLLSKILNNNRPLSSQNALAIMDKLSFPEHEKNVFWNSYLNQREKAIHKKPKAKDMLHSPIEDREKELEQEVFTTISEPFHFHILELVRLKHFKSDMSWISEQINQTLEVTVKAIDRLVKLGMLNNNDGIISRVEGRFTTKDKSVTNAAFKYHQKKILNLAIDAIDKYPIERRNQSSMTIAVNIEKIQIVKKMYEEFINQVTDMFETGDKTEVYQISLSLFPLTQTQSHHQERSLQ
jgi:uncharacterized protein (TIGR02147 family)